MGTIPNYQALLGGVFNQSDSRLDVQGLQQSAFAQACATQQQYSTSFGRGLWETFRGLGQLSRVCHTSYGEFFKAVGKYISSLKERNYEIERRINNIFN